MIGSESEKERCGFVLYRGVNESDYKLLDYTVWKLHAISQILATRVIPPRIGSGRNKCIISLWIAVQFM